MSRVFIYSFLFLFSFYHCEPVKYENACDPSSSIFQKIQAAKIFFNDKSPYCGLSGNFFASAGTSPDSNTVVTPIFSPSAGNYNTPQNIKITTTTSGATIYYTIDGSVPTSSSLIYNSAFSIWSAAGKTIRALATKSSMKDSTVLTGTFSYQPMKTRQTTIYSAGDDASYNMGVSPSYTGPAQHATFTSDYTTTDNATGLVWRSCSEGQSTSACTPAASAASLAVGTTACSNLNSANSGSGYAGRTNWRLPTMKELTTLTDFSIAAGSTPDLDSTAFPNTTAFAYWSSTPYPPTGAFGWYVDYQIVPNSYATTNTNPYHTRCVSAPAFAETTSYANNGDGTVKDNITGLIWQRCSYGQTNDTNCTGVTTTPAWAGTLTYCNGLSLASKTWRLPNRNELDTIMDFTKSTGASIDLTTFPNTDPNPYWSSTTSAVNTANAWYVDFDAASNVFSDTVSKATLGNVRCVTGP